MVNTKDLISFTAITAILAVVITSTGVIQLPGTSNTDFFKEITTDPTAPEQAKYRLKSSVKVNTAEEATGGIVSDASFQYSTEKMDRFSFSFAGFPKFSVLGSNNARLEYRLRKNGEIVASDAKFLGDLGTDVVRTGFETSNLESGAYTIEYIYYDEWNSLIGSPNKRTDSFTTQVDVPKQGELQ